MNIILRALEPGDIDAIYRWENDPDTWTYSAAHQPFSRHALQQFIDECSLTDIYASRQLRLMADNEEHHSVGCIDLFDFDPHHRRAGVGIIVEGSMRRQGVGTAMVNAMEEFARQHLMLHQLYCTVATDNTASIHLFNRCGFQQSGVLKQWLNNRGEWTDAYIYQKTIVD